MKPRVYSQVWTHLETGTKVRRWHVSHKRGCPHNCGCPEIENFPDCQTAVRFALWTAAGGSRWFFFA